MLYQFVSLPDETEISYSEVKKTSLVKILSAYILKNGMMPEGILTVWNSFCRISISLKGRDFQMMSSRSI